MFLKDLPTGFNPIFIISALMLFVKSDKLVSDALIWHILHWDGKGFFIPPFIADEKEKNVCCCRLSFLDKDASEICATILFNIAKCSHNIFDSRFLQGKAIKHVLIFLFETLRLLQQSVKFHSLPA